MPGPALHHLIAQRLTTSIRRGTGLGRNLSRQEYEALQALLSNAGNHPYLYLGCQGPDFFFFNTKDMNPTLGKFVEFYYQVYDFIEEFKQTLLKAVPQPVLDALEAFDEAIDETIEDSALLSELKQTFDDLNKLLEGFLANLMEALKKFVSEFNLFELISHPYRDGVSAPAKEKWWWFDAMHYRKTGKYAKALLDLSAPGSPEHLYAIGYLTHFAADTVGHPYVNIVSGGPYRSHAQRHKTGENYQDVLNFLNVTSRDFNRSKLHALYNFNFTGLVDEDNPDPFTNMPDKLSKLIADALNKVYQEDTDPEVEYGSPITTTDINNTYRLWYRWFKSATDTGTLPAPVPYSLTAELREVWEKTMDNLDEAGDFIENAVDEASDWGIWGIFLILAAVVVAAVMAAAALADGVAGAIATLGTSTIRYAACLIYEQLYNSFQSFRLAVAANGLAFPMTEHLGEPRLNHFGNPSFPDPSGATAATNAGLLPQLKWSVPFGTDPGGSFFQQERHLIYPLSDGEKAAALGAPADYFNKFSTYYAFGAVPFLPNSLDTILGLAASNNPMMNDNGSNLAASLKDIKLGNAMKLIESVYDRWKVKKEFPDFNLDADRGYGYPCWSQVNTAAGQVDPGDFPKEISVKSNPAATVDLRFIK
jgi:hypothetical protein